MTAFDPRSLEERIADIRNQLHADRATSRSWYGARVAQDAIAQILEQFFRLILSLLARAEPVALPASAASPTDRNGDAADAAAPSESHRSKGTRAASSPAIGARHARDDVRDNATGGNTARRNAMRAVPPSGHRFTPRGAGLPTSIPVVAFRLTSLGRPPQLE